MGQDKALLSWKGQPLLLHMRQLLLDAGARHVVLSGHHAGYGAISDLTAGAGPMAALAQLAPQLEDRPWIVVPVDMPHLHPSLIHALLRESGPCVSVRDHPLPMCLRIDASTRSAIAGIGMKTGRDCSLRALHDALSGRFLDEDPWRDQLANCNTPEQWAALRSSSDA